MNQSSPRSELLSDADDRASHDARLPKGGAWPFRRLLERLLRNVRFGSLAVELPGGQVAEGRGTQAGPQAAIVIRRWRVLSKLLMQGDLGLAEAYRDGDWTTPDLAAVLEFGARNESQWSGTLNPSWPSRVAMRIFHLARSNTKRGSRQNISFHYDMGNAFYRLWLDPQMIYSSALFRSLSEPDAGHGIESLELAQAAKLDRIIELLDMPSNAGVLEIGCGWGALAMAMARRCGAKVTGLTLSTEQLAYAQTAVNETGLSDKVDLRLQDYRDVQGTYDRIVSIEMLEAVGERYWPTYFETLHERLSQGGKAVVQVITIDDEHFDHYRSTTDFIQRFIFPGGMLPSVNVMREHARQAGLKMTTAESFGSSYAETLAIWRCRFMRAWPAIEALGFDIEFRRLWEYYLCYCEAGFRTGRVDVGLYVFTRQ